MRFWFAGPRVGFIRPGVSFNPVGRAPRAPTGERSFVYVIAGSHGLTKVGRSNSPETRLKELQTGSPYHLHIAHMVSVPAGSADAIEHEAHAILGDHNFNLEWFAVSSNLATAAVYGAIDRLGVSLDAPPAGPLVWPPHRQAIVIAACLAFAFFVPVPPEGRGATSMLALMAYFFARAFMRRPSGGGNPSPG